MAGSNLIGNSFGMFHACAGRTTRPSPRTSRCGADDWLFDQPWPKLGAHGTPSAQRGEV
ncbi:hypothetical protein QJS66_21565 [Kocuria rhizophila]|nr:hypothetical protein QJS66_21565 [Kocuria rhizophila]